MSFEELDKNRPGTFEEKHDPNKVRKHKCRTCPFGGQVTGTTSGSRAVRSGKQPIGSEFGEAVQQQLQAVIIASALCQGNRYCHQEGLEGKTETYLCRGARDIQLRYFCFLGVLSEPTDKCWRQKTEEIGLA